MPEHVEAVVYASVQSKSGANIKTYGLWKPTTVLRMVIHACRLWLSGSKSILPRMERGFILPTGSVLSKNGFRIKNHRSRLQIPRPGSEFSDNRSGCEVPDNEFGSELLGSTFESKIPGNGSGTTKFG
ncbi:hypothetical protein Trydic_g21714 [Trypoxylus dichotomus]